MSPRQRMEDYRTLRDSALHLLRADVAMVREDVAQRGLGARAIDRVSDAALDLLDDALDTAEANRGTLMAGAGAALAAGALWLARRPIIDLLAEALSFNEGQGEQAEEEAEPAMRSVRSQGEDQTAGEYQ